MQVNSQGENWVCEGSLEKGLQNRPNEEEIAVDESSMTPTSNVKGGVIAKFNSYFTVW